MSARPIDLPRPQSASCPPPKNFATLTTISTTISGHDLDIFDTFDTFDNFDNQDNHFVKFAGWTTPNHMYEHHYVGKQGSDTSF